MVKILLTLTAISLAFGCNNKKSKKNDAAPEEEVAENGDQTPVPEETPAEEDAILSELEELRKDLEGMKGSEVDTESGGEGVALAKVVYADIAPILETHCYDCHGEDAPDREDPPKTDYTTFATARPYGSLMPIQQVFVDLLEVAEQDAINAWIDTGLTEATYTASVKPILDAKCISCHSAEAPTADPMPKTSFADYGNARKYGSQMPTFEAFENLSADEQDLFNQWIADGLLEVAPEPVEEEGEEDGEEDGEGEAGEEDAGGEEDNGEGEADAADA